MKQPFRSPRDNFPALIQLRLHAHTRTHEPWVWGQGEERRETHSPVHVLLWRDGVGDELAVDGVGGVQRQLDNQAVDGRVLIDRHDAAQDLRETGNSQGVQTRRLDVIVTSSPTSSCVAELGSLTCLASIPICTRHDHRSITPDQ